MFLWFGLAKSKRSSISFWGKGFVCEGFAWDRLVMMDLLCAAKVRLVRFVSFCAREPVCFGTIVISWRLVGPVLPLLLGVDGKYIPSWMSWVERQDSRLWGWSFFGAFFSPHFLHMCVVMEEWTWTGYFLKKGKWIWFLSPEFINFVLFF